MVDASSLYELLEYAFMLASVAIAFILVIVTFLLWRLVRTLGRIADRLDEFGVPAQIVSNTQ